MAVFAYRAKDRTGRRVDGRIEGVSRGAVVTDLQARGLAPVSIREAASRTADARMLPNRRLAAAYVQMSDLLGAGVPLLRTLRLLGRGKAHARLATTMERVADRVADGDRLAEAMRQTGGIPEVHLAMIDAGERGGFLGDVLGELGTFLDHQAERRATVLGNLIYPAILVLAGVGIVIAALVFFVPKFATFFDGADLPFATRVLLTASDVLLVGWPYLLVLGSGLVIVWYAIRGRPGVDTAIARFALRLPLYGDLVRALAVARFTRMLGTLLQNGIPMINAMRISRSTTGNPLLMEAIDRATEEVGAGATLASPLDDSGLFGDDVVEMIEVGEAANTLPDVLVGIARTEERRTDRILVTLLKLMEPTLLLLLAGAVVFLFLALVVPMMQLSAEIS